MKLIKTRFFCVAAELALICAVFINCGGSPVPVSSAQAPSKQDELDTAIRETSDYLNKQLPKGNKLMILNVQSDFPALSEYIIDELIANTVNDRVFTVVDRQQLNTIRAELDFQMSGEVDDATAQSIGRMAGAQIIISGAVSRIGDLYRLRFRALSVQSAEIEGQFNRNIPDGYTVSALVNSKATGYGNNPAVASTSSTARQTSTATQTPAPTQTTTVPTPIQLTSEQPQTPLTYDIGDKGPAGGIVFYDKGNNSDGWRYLEAAPASSETSVRWGAYRVDAGGKKTGIGEGKDNTQSVLTAMNQLGESVPAVQYCVNLNIGGVRDWFLPSKAELNLMYSHLKMNGLGGFKNEVYWSSSEFNSEKAWWQNFTNGEQSHGYNWWKERTALVRPCRQF